MKAQVSTSEPEVTQVQGVRRAVSADGKTMRSARRRNESGRVVQDQVVEVLDHDSGAVLVCEQVEGEDEIAAVRAVLERLIGRWGSLSGVLLVADAKHTQHKLVDQVYDAGGWWLLPVKENQPSIFAQVTALPWSDLEAQDIDRGKSHGRRETRTVRVIQAPRHVDLGLTGAAQVIKIGRHTLRKKNPSSEPAWAREYAYLLTSLPAEVADAVALGGFTRSHWRIENQLHWVRDTAYDEDRHTARTGNGPVNLACLRTPRSPATGPPVPTTSANDYVTAPARPAEPSRPSQPANPKSNFETALVWYPGLAEGDRSSDRVEPVRDGSGTVRSCAVTTSFRHHRPTRQSSSGTPPSSWTPTCYWRRTSCQQRRARQPCVRSSPARSACGFLIRSVWSSTATMPPAETCVPRPIRT